MRLRRFNADGMHEFQLALARCRVQPETEIRDGLLESDAFTDVVRPDVQIAEQQFVTKEEAARYLTAVLSPLKAEELAKDAALWSWLALFFLDSICKTNLTGRIIRNDYCYIFEPRNSRHFYRHLLYLPWQILRLAPIHNRLFLTARADTYQSLGVDVMKRLFLTRIPCIFEVLDRLYWDEERRRPRSGISGSKITAGDLSHRFPTRIQQLEKTFDLISLDADQLIELLGEEFSFARPTPSIRKDLLFA